MSIKATIMGDAELAKTTVLNSPLDDDTKRSLITLITRSAMATNGITSEEKIQNLTECMASLASALATYMSKADHRLSNLEKEYREEHPIGRIDQIQRDEQRLHDVEEYRNMNGIVPNIRKNGDSLLEPTNTSSEDAFGLPSGIIDKIFALLMKPYIWIFGAIAVCSPFAVDVISTVINAFTK